jgi:hypothetical protein
MNNIINITMNIVIMSPAIAFGIYLIISIKSFFRG